MEALTKALQAYSQIESAMGDNFNSYGLGSASKGVLDDIIKAAPSETPAVASPKVESVETPAEPIRVTKQTSGGDAMTKALQAYSLIESAMGDNFNSYGLGSASKGVLDDIIKAAPSETPAVASPKVESVETPAEPIRVTKQHIADKIENIKAEQMSRVNDLLARFQSDDDDDDYENSYDEDFEQQ
jgi:hypothetical protein